MLHFHSTSVGLLVLHHIAIISVFAHPFARESTVPPEVFEFHPVEDLDGKIISKSIFTAPIFHRCPDGYRQDLQGVCRRLLRMDEQTYWNHLVMRLNKFYEAAQGQSMSTELATLPQPAKYNVINVGRTTPDNKDTHLSTMQTGPLRIQLPLTITRIENHKMTI